MHNVKNITVLNGTKEYIVTIRNGVVDRIRVVIGYGWNASHRDLNMQGPTARKIASIAA